MKIKAIPVFSEFDTWQAYRPEAPINKMSPYIVETSSLDLFFNNIYNMCYCNFPKQLLQRHSIKSVKHGSIINKVNYREIIEELWR
ncbi:MAG: hypothetical protein ACKPKO_05460, partial [Candidatus Fonsibacter sp.]